MKQPPGPTDGEDADRALLFVYGTLRAGAPMHSLLGEACEAAGTGTIRARLYDIGSYPGAVPSGEDGDRVFGELYRMRRPAAQLPELDRYEECGEDFPRPHEYRRELVRIHVTGGDRMRAWTYLYNLPTGGLPRIASGDYLETPDNRGEGERADILKNRSGT